MAAPKLQPRLAAAAQSLGFQSIDRVRFFKSEYEAAPVVPMLSFNVARRGDRVEVNPIVAVRWVALERLMLELGGTKDDWSTTLNVSLGYLTAEKKYRAWFFGDEADADEREMADLVGTVATAGTRFYERFSSVGEIVGALQRCEHTMRPSRAYRLPAALFLSGQREESAKELSLELAAVNRGAAADAFRAYAAALSKLT